MLRKSVVGAGKIVDIVEDGSAARNGQEPLDDDGKSEIPELREPASSDTSLSAHSIETLFKQYAIPLVMILLFAVHVLSFSAGRGAALRAAHDHIQILHANFSAEVQACREKEAGLVSSLTAEKAKVDAAKEEAAKRDFTKLGEQVAAKEKEKTDAVAANLSLSLSLSLSLCRPVCIYPSIYHEYILI